MNASEVTLELEKGWKSSSFGGGVDIRKEKIKLDVFVTDPIRIDLYCFSLWLDGYRAKEAAQKRRPSFSTEYISLIDIVLRDTVDQYRNFDMLEHYLESPELFSSQLLMQIDTAVFRALLDKYYEINEEVIRELVGKKLNSKLRSSLDDLSERTKVPIKCCRRQFDNLRRIYTYLTDRKRDQKQQDVTLIEMIQHHFKLSKELASQYSRYLFLCYHRIETTDKRLKFLSAPDFEYFSSVLMTQWTDDKLQLDLDKKFKEDVRDCRTHLLGDKVILDTYKSLVLDKMKQLEDMNEKKLISFAYKFPAIVKALLNIGAGISKSKEFEQIFEDLEEKIGDTCVRIGLTKQEVDAFFKFLVETFDPLLDTLTFTRHRQRFTKTWFRYLEGIRLCLLHMYEVMLTHETREEK